MLKSLKLILLVFLFIFIFTSFFYSSEKSAKVSKISFFKNNTQNKEKLSFTTDTGYLNSLNYYASSSDSSNLALKKFGIIFMAVGGGTLGLFYLAGIIAVAGSWAIVPKSKSDDSIHAASIGVSFIPLVGLYIIPYLTYQAYTNDGEEFGTAQEASTDATVAACIIVNFFQLAGLGMLIAGAVLFGTSYAKTAKAGNMSLLYYSDRKMNYSTKKFDDNLYIGLSFKL
ncbi:MAG: hypothetical protein JXB50_14100 [Spirochaetes bacterium]|nr:hypothetical protein [Spirochaetota bacterium]